MADPELELLASTKRDSPGGGLLRHYWQPAALSDELARDKPLPVTLLGEELILFRDGGGQAALIGRYCAHQGVDLIYGCVEPDGLRCMYHGWLFDNRGRVVMRGDWLPEKERRWQVGQPAYPIIEAGGIIFAFLGPGEPPVLPCEEFFSRHSADRKLTKRERNVNYLEALSLVAENPSNELSFVVPNVLAFQARLPDLKSWLRWVVPMNDDSHLEFNLGFSGAIPFRGEPHASLRRSLLNASEGYRGDQTDEEKKT